MVPLSTPSRVKRSRLRKFVLSKRDSGYLFPASWTLKRQMKEATNFPGGAPDVWLKLPGHVHVRTRLNFPNDSAIEICCWPSPIAHN